MSTGSSLDTKLEVFGRALGELEGVFSAAAELCLRQAPQSVPGTPGQFAELMKDLHQGVLIKVYVTIVQADTRWSPEEKKFAERLFQHLWPGGVPGGRLRDTANHVFREAGRLKWLSLLRPFQQIPALRDRSAEIEQRIEAIAQMIARADGETSANETAAIRGMMQEVSDVLHPLEDLLKPDAPTLAPARRGSRAEQPLAVPTKEIRETYAIDEPVLAEPADTSETRLAETLQGLDRLVGLAHVKQEIRTLTNFLRMQQQRAVAGLPQTKLSLHLVFGGNPGTGKTTVARIVGQIYGAMGILSRGHLVETDRSGLVAEFAGQTGPKTNKKVDEALDGVLFIDEAYSLVDESGEDPYGREALQTLLKRMEDDRERLVVILAGYSGEMDRLLRANPGLHSRFNTQLTFEDYTPGELGHIFDKFCEQNHYVATPAVQRRLLLGMNWLYGHRDERFGNARLVRNVFETAIRRLANRIASQANLTKELLTTFEPDDLAFTGVPPESLAAAAQEQLRLRVSCGGCGEKTAVPSSYLGKRVRCQKCQHAFVVRWGEPLLSEGDVG